MAENNFDRKFQNNKISLLVDTVFEKVCLGITKSSDNGQMKIHF